MNIREAVPEDAEAIQQVARRAWYEAYDRILEDQAIEEKLDEWYDRQRLRESIKTEDRPLFVAEIGEIVGFVQGGPSEDGPADASVSRIYVLPGHWREGLGTKLLNRLFDTLRDDGYDSVWVAVMAENEVGRSFYETHGFDIKDKRITELAGQEIEETILIRHL